MGSSKNSPIAIHSEIIMKTKNSSVLYVAAAVRGTILLASTPHLLRLKLDTVVCSGSIILCTTITLMLA